LEHFAGGLTQPNNLNIVVRYNYIESVDMPQQDSSLVADIRSASRDLVRQLGLMTQTVAGTDLTLSAVHAIIEIGRAGQLSARELSEKLQLEKSTVSRLVKSLMARGELRELRSSNDLRVKLLSLSRQGKKTLGNIDRHAEAQVATALDRLDSASRQGVLKGLQDYSAALGTAAAPRQPRHGLTHNIARCEITTGYTPTIIARTVEMMHSHMHRHFGFGPAFETRIAADLAEFMTRIGNAANQTWHAQLDKRIVGSISIDGQDLGDARAHLRWFVVDASIRGGGIGNTLLSRAVRFCDEKGFHETHLWTVNGLDAARKLYQQHGFYLAAEYYGDQWGTNILEQQFVRPRLA
jgi:DNA-binding MarR family transcriptional regulator/GNAT superfamily N-acetyltransferase